MSEDRTDVLVVGAGPVGLLTALLLAEAGIEVEIIDREERTAARSYACALHGRTLELLDRLGLAAPLIAQGRQVGTVAFYDGQERRTQVALSKLEGKFPFLLIVPQNVFEQALERQLRERAGISVRWNHRFDSFQNEEEMVAATVEELGGTGTGYIVPHWEAVVKRRKVMRARYLVGADGHHSLVRQRLGIEYTQLAGPECFAAYEFESDAPGPDEVRVVLDEQTTNVLWPLPGNKFRWTFQLLHSEAPTEFPEKERRAVRVGQKAVDERIRQYVQKVAQKRAPWFSASVQDIAWCTDVVFEHRLAREFGQGLCWLAGDAAHQTGPVGAQSMNVGFREAEALANALHKLLREEGSPELLARYSLQWQQEWQVLLGLNGGVEAERAAAPWVRERHGRLLSALPASNEALEVLARQLGLSIRHLQAGRGSLK